MDDFDKAIKLNPSFAQAYFERGLLRIDYGDYDGAEQDWQRAAELEPFFGSIAQHDWYNCFTRQFSTSLPLKLAGEEHDRGLVRQLYRTGFIVFGVSTLLIVGERFFSYRKRKVLYLPLLLPAVTLLCIALIFAMFAHNLSKATEICLEGARVLESLKKEEELISAMEYFNKAINTSSLSSCAFYNRGTVKAAIERTQRNEQVGNNKPEIPKKANIKSEDTVQPH